MRQTYFWQPLIKIKMKNSLRLEVGVQSLTPDEMQSVHGGEIPILPLAVLAPGVGVYVGVCTLVYYSAYGARVVYDSINKN